MWFQIAYGFRKWVGHRSQLLLIVLGLAIFNALVSITLLTGSELLKEAPDWVKHPSKFMTVGRTNLTGDFSSISIKDLNKLNSLPEIEDVMIFSFQTRDLELGDKLFQNHSVIYYDKKVLKDIDTSKLKSDNKLPTSLNGMDEGVYVSWSFWENILGAPDDIEQRYIKVLPSNKKYPILAVLPPEMNRIGHKTGQVWLPYKELAHTLPVKFNSSDSGDMPEGQRLSMAKMLMPNFPFFYGILKANQELTQEMVSNAVEESSGSDSEVGTIYEEVQKVKLVSGIEFDPKNKSAVDRQWKLLLVLVVCFGIVIGISLINVFTNQFVTRSGELKVRVALGANKASLLSQVILENLPLLAGVLVLGIAFSELIQSWLLSSNIMSEYFGKAGLPINFGLWATTSLVTVVFVLLCTCLPLLNSLHSSFFTRNRKVQRSRLQKYLSDLNTALQIGIALFSFVIAGSIYYLEIKERSQLQLDTSIEEVNVSSDKVIDLNSDAMLGHFEPARKDAFAIASSSFIEPETRFPRLSIVGAERSSTVVSRELYVTPNYFDVLGCTELANAGSFDKNGVVINRAMADILLGHLQINGLTNNTKYSDLIGLRVNVNDFEEAQYQVSSVIDNLPHFGAEHDHTPMIYLHINGLKQATDTRSFSALIKANELNNMTSQLAEWSENNLVNGKLMMKGGLAGQLKEYDKESRLLFVSALTLCVVIVLLMTASLYYQSKTIFQSEVSKIATQLAVGASLQSIYLRSALSTLLLVLMAMPISMFSLNFASPVLAEIIGGKWLSLHVIVASIFLVFLLVTVSKLLPLSVLRKKTIAELFRQ